MVHIAGSVGRVRVSGKDLVATGTVDEDRAYTDKADPSCETPWDEEVAE